MKKKDLAATISSSYDLKPRDAASIVDTVFNEIARALSVKNGSVSITGFGTFRRKDVPARKARPGRNPFTGEDIMIKARPASSKPAFSANKVLKEVVAGKVKPAAAPKPAAKTAAKPAAKPAKKAAAKKVVKKAAPKKKVAAKKPAKKAPARKAAPKKVAKKTARRK